MYENYKTYIIIGILIVLAILVFYCFNEHFGVTVNTGNPIVDTPANDLSNFIESLVELSQANTRATIMLIQTAKSLSPNTKKEISNISQKLESSYNKAITSLDSLKTMANDLSAVSKAPKPRPIIQDDTNIHGVGSSDYKTKLIRQDINDGSFSVNSETQQIMR